MPYSPLLIKPMREELTQVGIKELQTSKDVDEFMQNSGSTMVVINSVCGCAADLVRPAVQKALNNAKKPGEVATVFAGQDIDATSTFRNYIKDTPPSSPSIALFKDKKLVHFIPKDEFESRDATQIANDLVQVFDKYC